MSPGKLQATHFQLDDAKVQKVVEALLALRDALGIDPLAMPVHVAAAEVILALRLYPTATDDDLCGIRQSAVTAETIVAEARRYQAANPVLPS